MLPLDWLLPNCDTELVPDGVGIRGMAVWPVCTQTCVMKSFSRLITGMWSYATGLVKP